MSGACLALFSYVLSIRLSSYLRNQHIFVIISLMTVGPPKKSEDHNRIRRCEVLGTVK